MKKLLPFIFLIAITLSCNKGITHLSRNERFLGFDFTAYSEKDFLFTPESYLGKYESRGMVSFIVTPEANLVDVHDLEEDVNYSVGAIRVWVVEEIDINDVIKGMYDRCILMGADALVNFDVDTQENIIPSTTQPITQYTVSGFAIKRD